MSKTIFLTDDQVKSMVETYGAKIQDIDEQIKALKKKRSDFEDLINQLNSNQNELADILESKIVPNENNEFRAGYSKDWSVPKKAKYVLSKFRKEMSTTEVFEIICKYEPAMMEKRVGVMVLLSGAFGDNAKMGKLYYRVGNKRTEYKYGLLEWQKEEAV